MAVVALNAIATAALVLKFHGKAIEAVEGMTGSFPAFERSLASTLEEMRSVHLKLSEDGAAGRKRLGEVESRVSAHDDRLDKLAESHRKAHRAAETVITGVSERVEKLEETARKDAKALEEMAREDTKAHRAAETVVTGVSERVAKLEAKGREDVDYSALQQRVKNLEAQLSSLAGRVSYMKAPRSSAPPPSLPIDFASAGVGARIDYATSSPPQGRDYVHRVKQLASAIGLAPHTNVGWPADVVLEKHLVMSTGRCFSIPVVGHVTVMLPMKVLVSAVGIEHPPSSAAHGSGPKLVRASTSSAFSEGVLADWDVTEKNVAMVSPPVLTDQVTFAVESNGGADFTCLYRINVYGDPGAPPA